jgi:hypothetical protein
MFFLRVIFGAWNHPFYTAFIGIGLALARLNTGCAWKAGAPLLGWLLAMFVHSLHNTLAIFVEDLGTLVLLFLVDWLGWIFMAAIAFYAVWREKKWIQTHLKSEVQAGALTQSQYEVVISPWRRFLAMFNAIGQGRFRDTQRFYHLCVELAYKKHQFDRVGETRGNPAALIEQLREEVQQLSPRAVV